jgi:hypothetical protein
MGLQPFNGHEIAATELSAAELIPAYTIVKYNATDKTKVNLAGAGDSGIGVVLPSDEEMMSDGAGGTVKRTGYQIGEYPTIYDEGTVFVKLGAVVVAGDKCVPMVGGLGAKLAADSFTAWNLAASPANTAINAAGNQTISDILAAFAARDTVIGKYRASGNIGDIVPVKIK